MQSFNKSVGIGSRSHVAFDIDFAIIQISSMVVGVKAVRRLLGKKLVYFTPQLLEIRYGVLLLRNIGLNFNYFIHKNVSKTIGQVICIRW